MLIAFSLHGAIALWLTLPDPEPLPTPPPLRINLLATVADSTVNATTETPELPAKPIAEPIVETPVKAVPDPTPPPVIEQVSTQPQAVSKAVTAPQLTQPRVVNNASEAGHSPELIQDKPATDSAQASTMQPDAVSTARYEQLLVAWLEKYKKYPRHAKRLRIEGEGKLRILIDRTGQTQHITLEQSTGNRLLDTAALKMAQRANPFPSMPKNDPRQQLEFVVPVAFLLN